MVVGFNHNFRYKGEVYHIQTEDSGVKSPNIVTLLYQGGTILGSKKTSYADIARVDNLDQVVEELMKEQHKEMLRSLKAGEFDAVIERFQAGKKGSPQRLQETPPPAATVLPPVVPAPPAAPLEPVSAPQPTPAAEPPPTAAAREADRPAAAEVSLDDIILSYLMGDDK